ncbi:MAG: hypothetical protein WBW80_17020 [Acidimicrobiales bacterium]
MSETPQSQPEEVLLRIGEIGVSRSFVVTPSGTCQLNDAKIDSLVQTTIVSKAPTWAVVVAFVFIFTWYRCCSCS